MGSEGNEGGASGRGVSADMESLPIRGTMRRGAAPGPGQPLALGGDIVQLPVTFTARVPASALPAANRRTAHQPATATAQQAQPPAEGMQRRGPAGLAARQLNAQMIAASIADSLRPSAPATTFRPRSAAASPAPVPDRGAAEAVPEQLAGRLRSQGSGSRVLDGIGERRNDGVGRLTAGPAADR